MQGDEDRTTLNEPFSRWMADYLGGEEEAERAIAATPEMRRRQAERAMAAVEKLSEEDMQDGQQIQGLVIRQKPLQKPLCGNSRRMN